MSRQPVLSERQARMLVMEEKTCAFYLVEGSNSLSSLEKATGFYPVAFGLLASGLERLLKLDLILYEAHHQGSMPTRSRCRKVSHDLRALSGEVLQGSQRPAVRGRELLKTDRVLATLLDALTEFAKDGRYLYMDQILGRASTFSERPLSQVEDAIFALTSTEGDFRTSWMWSHVLRGEMATFVRRRNEYLIEALIGYLQCLIELFRLNAEMTEAGYLRVFLIERAFGRCPTRKQFRAVVGSPALDGWEDGLVAKLAGAD